MSGGGDQRLEITAGDRIKGDANSNAVDISSSSGSVVVVNLGAIYSSGGRGVNASVAAGGTDLTIASSGSIEGGSYGIDAISYGSGGVSVSVNDVTGQGTQGVNVSAAASTTGTTLDVYGTVTGQANGIAVGSASTGEVVITLASGASASGQTGAGVVLVSYGNASVQGTGTVLGASRGINALTVGSDITVDGLDSVTGQGSDGVYGLSQGGNITVSDVGTIFGIGGTGINANSGTGDVSIQGVGLTGGVTGTGGDGIDANQVTGGSVDIGGTVAIGDVTGSARGVYARTTSGNITVNSTGTVSGGTGMGVIAWSTGSGDVDVDVAAASSSDAVGIGAYSAGGDVDVTSASTIGEIFGIATTTTGAGTITVEAGDASANSSTGILATHVGSGDISVSASGTVTSVSADGITTRHSGTGAQSVTADGTVSGGRHGIFASTSGGGGGGEIVINLGASASVTGQGGEGIRVADVGGSTATVMGASGGGVTGSSRGVYISTSNSDITVDGLDSITGQSGDGTNLRSNGGTITVSDVGTVLGIGGGGIRARSAGGDISIQGVGLVGGVAGTAYDGIAASAGGGAVNIGGVTAIGGVTGLDTGIQAQGAGDITVTSTGVVEGGLTGIYSLSYGGGGTTAINVYNVSGGLADGIHAMAAATAGDISVTATGTAIGGNSGVYVYNGGNGSTTINVGAAVGSTVGGITALNSGVTTDLSVTATGDVTGGNYGVFAQNAGSGATTVSTVTATGDLYGIFAYGVFGSSNLSVTSTGTVTGTSGTGINAINAGSGALTVSTAGVSGGSYDGIYVNQSPGGTSTRVTATGPVTGNYSGVYMLHYGSDAATVSVGDATGTTYAGIYAYSSGTSTGLTITSTGTASGGVDGIVGIHYGTGDVTVQANTVTGNLNDGIAVTNAATGGALSIIATGPVTGGDEGIDATAYGTGGLSITALGTVTGGDRGVQAISYGSGSVTISLAGVSGGTHGIEVYNAATDATTISVSGAVTGAAGEGIYTATAGGATITIASGASVSGTGAAIETDSTGGGGNAVSDTVTLEAGASLSGSLLLHAGADTFNDASGVFTAALGGAGTDTLNFSGTGRTIDGSNGATDMIREFEVFNFNAGGFTLAGTHQSLDAANFNTGTNSLTGTLQAAAVTIADGATLAAADATSITGNLTNAGTLAIGNSPGTVTVTGNFTQTGTGDLPIEIDGADYDQLIVTGDVTLDGNLGVSILGGTSTGTQTRRIIDGGGTLSGNFASVDGSNGLLITNSVTLDAANADVLLTTTLNSASTVSSLTPNQIAVGDNLIGQLAGSSIDSALAALANAIGTTADPEALAARLSELGPEVTDLGLKFLSMAQDRFTREMLDRSAVSTGGGGEGIQVWGSVTGSGVSQDGGSNYSDFDATMFQVATGITDIPVGSAGSNITVGVAAGFSDFSGETPSGTLDGSVLGDKTDANAFHAGVSLAVEDLTVAGVDLNAMTAFSFASGKQDIDMNLTDPVSGSDLKQPGTADFMNLDWLARLTAEGTNGDAWPVKPFLELGVARTQQDGFSLSSGTATSLDVEDFDAVRGSVGLGLAFDHQLSDATGLSANFGGTKYFGDTQNVINARFSDSSSGSTFATAGKDVDWQARFDAGAHHRFDNGLNLDAQVFGETGSLTSVGAGVTLSIRF